MISFEKRKDYVFWHSLIARHNTHNILQPSGNTSSKYSLSTCQASSASSMGSVWICLDVTLQFTGICLQSVFMAFISMWRVATCCHSCIIQKYSKDFESIGTVWSPWQVQLTTLFQVQFPKKSHVTNTTCSDHFLIIPWRFDVKKVHSVVARRTFGSQMCQKLRVLRWF